MGGIGLFDLEKHFAFYGAYHSNPINIAIHALFVWPIFFSALLLLHFTPSFFDIPNFEFPLFGYDVVLAWNLGFAVALVYSVFYTNLDLKAGSLAALLCTLCWLGSSFVATQLGFSLAWKVVLVVQLVCWTGQFIGHGVFEKRAPALLDNLVQALVMAPFFVLLEGLQTLFGYEPYPGFHSRVQEKIEADINEWQEIKQKLLA
ncbi:putative endoplasmic reticulum membrane protein C16E8.02-like [Senna tora]|uniref:Putative endoplasmic reticulum membrane protein C16E8.02-like n=1 Tax=Senna tora TaxID=362788 RepID=A0A834WRW2_9FABA|nr:putative endoplasmic reticulum membrane protein C16E8.02-like [Senna tora]